MTTGATLTIVLLGLIIAFLLIDLVIWLAGGQTASQWIIAHSKRSKLFAICTLLAILTGAALLIIHWELPSILLN